MSQPSVTVIGTGALGSTLARALYHREYTITSLYNRSPKKAKKLSQEVEAKYVSTFPSEKEDLGTLIFITVHDSEIAPVVSKLSRIKDDFKDHYVVHCSGNEQAGILNPVQKKGAGIAAFHPLQTFTSQSGIQDFRGIYFDVEADHETTKVLDDIAHSLGSKTINISKDAKPYLHAAAVVASNYLVTLLHTSGRIAELGGLDQDEAVKALLPLVGKTLQNLGAQQGLDALTGPIVRGDVETVRTHLELLEHNNDLLKLYKMLGLETLQIAKKSQRLPEALSSQLLSLLKQHE